MSRETGTEAAWPDDVRRPGPGLGGAGHQWENKDESDICSQYFNGLNGGRGYADCHTR